jgi:SAM-dependent methyltransferase
MDATKVRRCGVCGRDEVRSLRHQEFLLPGETRTGYDVVSCVDCGFCFARPLDGFETALGAHYQKTRKYAYEGSGNVAEGLLATHRASADFIVGRIRDLSPPLGGGATAVLDVGCATGQLLSFLRDRGLTEIMGLDPAPECRKVARRLFDLDVKTGTLADFRSDRRFGAIVLWNVLEHVLYPATFVASAGALLDEEGVVFLQLPDAGRFGYERDEPFQELSVEHVNYFTDASLAGLMANCGFQPIEIRSEVVRSGGSSGAVLTAVFRKTAGVPPGPADAGPFARYLEWSSGRLAAISAAIDALVEGREELVVWGAGALTARLLVDTRLAQARIVAFVDSDSALHGRTLAGRPVLPPESLRGGLGTVLVASVRWESEILSALGGPLEWRGAARTLRDAGFSRS